jgi:ADP-ribosylation factor GTPase-activating protein 1
MDYKQVLFELKKIEGNDKCIDCGESDPQWASLNYGVLLCSKCYDIHRSLSEEDTFFSLTNDKWSEDQIKRLQFGGNNNAIKFFETQSEYLKDMSIKEKYTSNFSKIYSDKLLKKCESDCESSSPSNKASSHSKADEPSYNEKGEIKDGNPCDGNLENSYLNNFGPNPNSILDPNLKEYDNITLLRVYRPSKEKNEEFFAKLGRENELRREDIPPSQGGKYTGFGSKPLQTENPQNDNLAQIQKGLLNSWNILTKSVNSLNENILKPASNAVRDPKLHQDIGNYAESIKRSLAEKANNTRDQISSAVQTLIKDDSDDELKNDLNLSNEDSDSSTSKLGKEPYIVVDYDLIENSDNDIFSYSKNDNFLNRNIIENNNDLTNRRNSSFSFTSVNESLSRAYSIGSSNSLFSLKISKSNRGSASNIGSLLNSPNLLSPFSPKPNL